MFEALKRDISIKNAFDHKMLMELLFAYSTFKTALTDMSRSNFIGFLIIKKNLSTSSKFKNRKKPNM